MAAGKPGGSAGGGRAGAVVRVVKPGGGSVDGGEVSGLARAERESMTSLMPSWVRFSVAVYLGLLLAGAVIAPEPIAAGADERPAAPVRVPWSQAQPPHHPQAKFQPVTSRSATPDADAPDDTSCSFCDR